MIACIKRIKRPVPLILNLRPYLDAVRYVRIIASRLDTVGIAIAIPHRHIDRFAIRQHHWHFFRRFMLQ